MKAYKVFGCEYDSWYQGNTYSSRDLAEQEAEFLNKEHQAYEVWSEVIKSQRIYNKHKYGTIEYYRDYFRNENQIEFMYDYMPSDPAGLYVYVSEIDILDKLPEDFKPSAVDIHSQVINWFKG